MHWEGDVDPYSKDKLLSFYNFHLQKFGDRPEALRWTPQGQLKRYQMLADIASPEELEQQHRPGLRVRDRGLLSFPQAARHHR